MRQFPDKDFGRKKRSSIMKRSTALILIAALVTGLIGCSTSDVVKSSSDGSITIDLSALTTALSGLTTGSATTVAATPSSTPEQTSSLPTPASSTNPPVTPTSPSTTPATVDTKTAIAELKDKYGVSIAGNYTDVSVSNALTIMRQLYPEDTKGLTITYSNQDGGSVGGYWTGAGRILIYKKCKEILYVVFHEVIHHATLYRESGHGAQVAEAVVTAIGKGSNPNNFPASVITRSYAQSSIEEFWAELFSVFRIQNKNLVNGSMGFTTIRSTFNPPESLRPAINKMYPDATSS